MQRQLLVKFTRLLPIASERTGDLLEALEEIASREPLVDEWRDFWERWQERAGPQPPELISRIEKILGEVGLVDPALNALDLDDNAHVVFLLGAGASAPAPSGIPTVKELLPQLLERAKRIGRDDLDKLVLWCKTKRIDNIEDLMTAAHIANFAAKNGYITNLLDYFLFARTRREVERNPYFLRDSVPPDVDASSIALLQDTLQTLFGLLANTMISASPNIVHAQVAEYLGKNPNAYVITTNYDACIDQALAEAGVATGPVGADLGEAPDAVPRLVKMHGSINWTYCDSCQEVREFGFSEVKTAFEDDTLSYAVIGICKNCGGQRRPLLVPPLSMKFMMFPNLIGLWNNARNLIEKSRVLIVIGYSFAEADSYITKIVSRSLGKNPHQQMVVVDSNPRLVTSLREKLTAHIKGFDPERIVRAVGDCSELVPRVLDKGRAKESPQLAIGEVAAGDRD
jgi:NAD-dependent SIR2 family protein deacetylase